MQKGILHGNLATIAVAVVVLAFAGYALAAHDKGLWPYSSPATPRAGCYYHQVQCIRAPCPPELICP